jgi:hypothetical protein
MDRPWGVEVPVAPGLSSITGSFPAGTYQVKLTYVDDLGEESGASKSGVIELGSGSGLRVMLPQPAQETVDGVSLYITPVNGGEFYYVTTVPVGTGYIDIVGGKYAYPLRTEHLTPPEPGQVLGARGGRVYYLAKGVVWYTEAYEYGLVKKSSNYIQLSSDIIDGVVVGNGLYVSDGRTHFMSGEPGQMTDAVVSHSSMVKGTPLVVDGSVMGDERRSGDVAVWMSDYGMMLGDGQGSVEELTRERVSFPVGETGTAQLIERSGIRQIITTLKEPFGDSSNVSIGDRVTAEVKRNGVIIN